MKTKMTVLFLVALLSVLTACDSSQIVRLSGSVRDAATQLPIAGATVSDGSYGSGNSAVTDETGSYGYETCCEEHTVTVIATGYASRSVTVTTPFWPSSNPLTLDITLDRSP
jgi:hypothetical protein